MQAHESAKQYLPGRATQIMNNAGNPINISTVNLTGGSTLAFLLEDPTEYTNEHLSKTTVDGAPAVDGVNISIAANGNGSIITVIPEPSGAALIGLAGLAMIFRRRKG